MTHRAPRLAGTVLLGGVLLTSMAAPALAACDAYSRNCTEPPRVLPNTVERDDAAPTTVVRDQSPSALPFTGGELVLLSTTGVAAVGAGAALVAAGRRRRHEG